MLMVQRMSGCMICPHTFSPHQIWPLFAKTLGTPALDDISIKPRLK